MIHKFLDGNILDCNILNNNILDINISSIVGFVGNDGGGLQPLSARLNQADPPQIALLSIIPLHSAQQSVQQSAQCNSAQ